MHQQFPKLAMQIIIVYERIIAYANTHYLIYTRISPKYLMDSKMFNIA
jgi:hypothetical protein